MKEYASIREFVETKTAASLLKIIPRLSDSNILRLMRQITDDLPNDEAREFVTKMILRIKSAVNKSCPACRKHVLENFLVNAVVKSGRLRDNFRDRYGFDPPSTLVLNPTMRCNLRCYGCYTAEYSKKDDMPEELLDRILTEAKEMGIFFVVVSGGEPFCSEVLLKMFEKHNDMFFQVYTNGTLLDGPMVADKICKLGNIMPCISVEGYEEHTDLRRGKGTYGKIMDAMDLLKKNGAIFGFSATATRENNDLITSDEFIEHYVDKGCFIGWYFQYIPVGREPDLNLVPTPEQRIRRGKRIRELRQRYPIILADFWNDGNLVGGCIAGGRSYLNITVQGDVEPCAFSHFAVDNIKNKSLAEVLQSDFFRDIRSRQPYSDNLLRPCMIIDNPDVLREIVARHNARPTHSDADSIIKEFAQSINKMSAEYKTLADKEWECRCSS